MGILTCIMVISGSLTFLKMEIGLVMVIGKQITSQYIDGKLKKYL